MRAALRVESRSGISDMGRSYTLRRRFDICRRQDLSTGFLHRWITSPVAVIRLRTYDRDMESPLPSETRRICGEQITYEPTQCTRPPGHGGDHDTEVIPPQLAGAVASIVREQDSLRSARATFEDDRAQWLRRSRLISLWAIGATGANIALAVVWVVLIVSARS